MYRVEDRDRIRDLLIEKARADPLIVAAALVGSTVTGGDRWSDLDLTFGGARGVPVETGRGRGPPGVGSELAGVVLFDLPVDATIYRVFLLPGALQVDLSFTPEEQFGARSPRFR